MSTYCSTDDVHYYCSFILTESGEACEHSDTPLTITCDSGEITILAAAYGVYSNDNTCGSYYNGNCVASSSLQVCNVCKTAKCV